MTHIHWVVRGTGTPKHKDEVYKSEVSECDGWVCDLDMMGEPSILKMKRRVEALAKILTVFALSWLVNTVRWQWKSLRSCWTRWTPEASKKRSVSLWVCKNKIRTNSLCNLPEVFAIDGINEISLGGLLLSSVWYFLILSLEDSLGVVIIVGVVFSNFVSWGFISGLSKSIG